MKLIDQAAEKAQLVDKELMKMKVRKRTLAKKALKVGMVTTQSPSPLKKVAAGFCRGVSDLTDEDGEVVFNNKQGIGNRNCCQQQLISLAKHALDGGVWKKIRREMIDEMLNEGCTVAKHPK